MITRPRDLVIFMPLLVFLAFFSVAISANPGYIDTNATNQAYVCHNSVCDDYGIINFELESQDSITIHSDNGISGYVWGNELGWINFAPTGSGVVFANSETGLLSGYAWSQVSGWINFAPTGQSVYIDPNTGEFSGWAWTGGVYGGWIKFDCSSADTCVKTTWSPSPDIISSGSGGGTTVVTNPNDPVSNTPTTTTPTETSDPETPVVNPPTDPEPEIPSDPETPTPPVVPPPPNPDPGNGAGNQPSSTNIDEYIPSVGALRDDVADFFSRPVVDLISKIITGIGLLSFAIGGLLNGIWSLPDIWLSLVRLWSLAMYGIGAKKRRSPWGTVYDSVTKQPLDPAYVVLSDLTGEEVATSITDLDGRYGFLVAVGRYSMFAKKTNYIFPSTKLEGRTHDELYEDLYFGGPIDIDSEGGVITKNIPLDRVGFDWNEFAKKERNKMRFFKTRHVLYNKIFNSFFFLGFILSAFILFFIPKPYNIIIFALYLIFFALRKINIKYRKKGSVVSSADGAPLSYGIVRINSVATGQEIAHSVLDEFGNYYCIIPNGIYTASVEKKNDDGSYSKIFNSPAFKVENGILRKNFQV